MRAFLYAALALTCSLQVGCAAAPDPTGPDADLAQPRGQRKSIERYFHPETLAFNHLEYDLHFADNLFLLHQEPRVLAVDCSSPGYLTISVSDASVASSWVPGTLLVGDKSLGCLLDGRNVPFYRGVKSVKANDENFDSTGSETGSLHVETSEASVENCFKNADIKYRSVPVGHAEHPVFPNKASLREGLNSTDKRRQLRSILPDINFDWREDFGPLSLNYDPNANGGAGGAKDPRLDFPIPITKGRKRESQDSERKVDGNGGRFDARVEVACKDCYTSYPSAGVSFALKISTWFTWYGLPQASFDYLELMLDGELVVSFGVLFDVRLRASLLDSGRKTVFETAPVDVDFRASGVPFWIDLSGRLQARTTLDLIAEFTISAGIKYEAAYRWGFRYTHHEGFKGIQEMENDFGSYLDFDGDLKMEIGVHFYLDFIAKLWGSIPVVVGPKFSLFFDLGFKIKVWHAESRKERECHGLGYQLAYRLGFGLGVEPISITIFPLLPSIDVTQTTFRLPIDIIPKTPFPFDFASGCWSLEDHPDKFGFWKTGTWSECDALCGRGEISRTVQCVNSDGEEIDEVQCLSEKAIGIEKPPTSLPCNDFSCDLSDLEIMESQCVYNTLQLIDDAHWKGVRSRCTWEKYYNDECDADCNTPLCKEDNGNCKEANEKYEACEEYGSDSCDSCLQVDEHGANCGWCKSTSRCLPGSLTGPEKDRACPLEDWEADTCVLPEVPLSFLSPLNVADQGFITGETYQVAWSGGKADAQVKLYLALNGSNAAKDGLGLPNDEIPTTPGNYDWTIPCNLQPAHYFLVIESTSDSKNTAVSEVFEVRYPGDNESPEHCDYDKDVVNSWMTHPWSPCKRECDGFSSIGCFEDYESNSYPESDDNEEWLVLLAENDRSMTPKYCSEIAARNKFPFAAVRHGRNCYGGYSYQVKKYTRPSRDCNVHCIGDRSLTCGGVREFEIFEVVGVQTRDVQCFENVWTIDEKKVDDDRCNRDNRISGEKPLELRACNLDVHCPDRRLKLGALDTSDIYQAGSDIEINWHGGTQYGQVFIQVQQTRSGIFGAQLNETESPWLQSEVGLPDTVENDGNFTWSVPSDIPSGRYLIKVVSASDESNQAVLLSPISIQSNQQFSLVVIPYFAGPTASMRTFPGVDVLMVGTLGNTSVNMHNEGSIDRGNGVWAWSVNTLDIGRITSLTYSANGPAGLEVGALVVHDGSQYHQVGTSPHLEAGQEETRPVCDHLSGSCATCTQTPGCGYCAETEKCMATSAGLGRPLFGWCPQASWSENANVCADKCRRVNTCDKCLSTLGCGWCAETCECMSKSFGGGTSFDFGLGLLGIEGQCPSGWLRSLPKGQTCGAAKGDKCSSKPVVAKATFQVDVLSQNFADINVDASETTECRTCNSLNCGSHGFCKATGPNVRCVCTDGYSGDSCQEPPEKCYGVDCSGVGLCFVTGSAPGLNAEEQCACLPGYSGANCEFEEASTGIVQRRLLDVSDTVQFEDSGVVQRRLLDTPDIGIFSVGCFEAKTCGRSQLGVFKLREDDAMTPRTCAEHASNSGFPFAALMKGRICYGAFSFKELTASFESDWDWSTPSDNCKTPCSGNSELTCGGECAIEAYETVRFVDIRIPDNKKPYKDISLSVDGIVDYHLVNTELSNYQAEKYCQDKFGGELLTVENEEQLHRRPQYIAYYYFNSVAETLVPRNLDFQDVPQRESRLQYWMGYRFSQREWHSLSGASDTTYIKEKVDSTSPFRSPVTGDCAFGDIVAGEQAAKIFFGSCRRSMPFICVASRPPKPPPTLLSPPLPPSPPAPQSPYPPFAASTPEENSCYSWALLEAPEGATPYIVFTGAKTAKIQDVTRSGLYKLYFEVADSDGHRDIKILEAQVQLPTFPPPHPSVPPPGPPPSPQPPPAPPATPCEICSLCVQQMYQGVLVVSDGLVRLRVPSDQMLNSSSLESACSQGKGVFSSDNSCSHMVLRAKSEDFLAFRAGALCNVLGSCNPSDECTIKQPGGGAQQVAMDFCTMDGTVNGELVGTKTAEPEEGACFEDSDCSGGAMCETWAEDVSRVLECQADGLDLVKAKGKCKNPCETALVQDLLQSMNTGYKPCQTRDDCDEGEVCGQSSDSCKTYTCNPETGQVSSNDCNRMCQATKVTLAGAGFQNDGNLVVDLTSSALAYAGACGPLFDTQSADMLGSSAECLTRDKELHILLKGDASVVVGDTLHLGASQRSLVSKVGLISFQGSTQPISKCSNCDNPKAVLTGPTILNEMCTQYTSGVIEEGEFFFSGASSTGPSNRPFTSVLWELVSQPYSWAETGKLLLALKYANDRNYLKVNLGLATVNELPPGDYTLNLTVTSFLGTSSTAEHAFRREPTQWSMGPSVSIAASDAPYSEGIALEASVSTQDFLCTSLGTFASAHRGYKMAYQWHCGLQRSGQDEECTILDGVGVRSRSSLFIPSTTLATSGIQIGDRLTFYLAAVYEESLQFLPFNDVYLFAKQTVEVLGDKLIARLEGPSGDVQMGGVNDTILFSAHESEDPSDPSDRLEPMRYKFHCERVQDKLAPCFKDWDYFGHHVSGYQWVVDTSQFAEPNVEYYMYVTVAKGTEGVNRRTASAAKVINPRAHEVVHTEITRFCLGDASCASQHVSTNPLALSVRVNLEGPYDKSLIRYRWSFFQEEVEGTLDSEDIIILPGKAQSNSGIVVAKCLVYLMDGTGRRSMAVISVPSRGPPVCGSKEGCLRISRSESTFPQNFFVADAVGWSSDSPLRFEFGFKSEDGAFKVVQPMSQKSTTTYRAAVGSHKPYVCAYDSNGGKACSESFFVLNEPPEGYTAQQLVSNLKTNTDFQELLGTGDDASVWEAVQDVVSQLSAVSEELNQEEKAFVESLLADASNAVASISNSEVADAGVGLRTINTENSLIQQGMQVDSSRLLQSTAAGLRLLERAQELALDVETAGNAMENTFSAVTSTNTRARSLLADLSAQDIAHRMDFNFASIGRQLAQNTLPGSTNRIQRERASISILRTSSRERLSTADIRFSESENGGPSVKFLGESFPSWCTGNVDCSKQDSFVAVGTYLQDSGPYIDATFNLYEALQEGYVEDVEVVSGVLELQLEYEGKANQLLCDESDGCQLQLLLPLQQGVYNASKSHACLRIVPSAEAYKAVRSISYEAVPTTDESHAMGSCTSNGLGKHAIIQYTNRTNPPEIGLIGDGPRPGRTRSKAFDVYVTVDLAVNGSIETNQFSSHVAKEQLMSDLSQALAVGLYRLDSDLMGDGQGQMCITCVKATKLEVLDSGLSLVTLALYLPDNAPTERTEALKGIISDAPLVELFSESEFSDKVKGVSLQKDDVVELQPEPGPGDTSDDDSSNRAAVIGGAVGGAVGGALFLAIVALIAVYVCKKKGLLGGKMTKKSVSNPLCQKGNQATVHIQRIPEPSNQADGRAAGREATTSVPNPDLEEGGTI